MTEQVRYRIDRRLVKEAERICGELGLTPTQAVSLFFAQLVKLGGLPFRPSNFPAIEGYGAALASMPKPRNEEPGPSWMPMSGPGI